VIDEDVYRTELQRAYIVLAVVAMMPLDEMIDEISRAEALAPILDPTAFREKGRAMLEDRRLLVALRDVRDACPLQQP
jgi:hypothetical protein